MTLLLAYRNAMHTRQICMELHRLRRRGQFPFYAATALAHIAINYGVPVRTWTSQTPRFSQALRILLPRLQLLWTVSITTARTSVQAKLQRPRMETSASMAQPWSFHPPCHTPLRLEYAWNGWTMQLLGRGITWTLSPILMDQTASLWTHRTGISLWWMCQSREPGRHSASTTTLRSWISPLGRLAKAS